MMAWERIYVVAPVSEREWANTQATGLDPDEEGEGTFSVPLSADGTEPATHYGASTLIRPHTLEVVKSQLLPAKPDIQLYEAAEGWSWRTVLEDVGLELIQEDL